MTSHEPIVLAEFWTALERVAKGVVTVRVWHGMSKTPAVLRHIPGYGAFHCLVVDPGTLDWAEDVVFREMGILVRFVIGDRR